MIHGSIVARNETSIFITVKLQNLMFLNENAATVKHFHLFVS